MPYKEKNDCETVTEGKLFILENRLAGCVCPCCGQINKVYRRSINATMYKCLQRLQKRHEAYGDDYQHVRDFAYSYINGDTAKLKLWGFIEQLENKDDKTKRTLGMWRITEKGRLFLAGNLAVPKYLFVYDNEIIGESGQRIKCDDIKTKKFDYQEIQ